MLPVIILILAIAVLTGFAVGGFMGAPWVPAKKRDVEKMLDDADIKSNQLFIELGCGDGRMLRAASMRGAKAVGYEINPVMWLIAAACNLGSKNVTVRLGSFWNKDLSSADVVMAFLMPRFMGKLDIKLAKELKPGAVFISYIFKLPRKEPVIKRKSWFIYKF